MTVEELFLRGKHDLFLMALDFSDYLNKLMELAYQKDLTVNPVKDSFSGSITYDNSNLYLWYNNEIGSTKLVNIEVIK